MRKVIFAVFLFLSFIIFPFTDKASAVEMSVGASTWYCWWESINGNDMNLNPTLVYGPVVSMRFTETWSLAAVFLYGQFHSSSSNNGGSNNEGPDAISRYDSDLSLNYNINRYFKIFGGGKFMGFNWDEGSSNGTHWSTGPGLGIGTTLPLTNSLYLLFNVSGTYSWGKHDDTYQVSPGIYASSRVNITERGFNTNLSFAYYFASASTSLNLGFRYQYLFIDYSLKDRKDEAHNFYGTTLSVVYSF